MKNFTYLYFWKDTDGNEKGIKVYLSGETYPTEKEVLCDNWKYFMNAMRNQGYEDTDILKIKYNFIFQKGWKVNDVVKRDTD